jgi:diguanylate cyclase (GGDEF)-like protein/PAS domain S-box-containing protein
LRAKSLHGQRPRNSDEYEVCQPDGSVRTFLIGRSPLRDSDGSVYGLCAVATDISLRTQTKQALQEAWKLFEQALEHAPIGMALVGLDGRWTRINKALCQMMGYPQHELIRMTFEDITHPDDLSAGRELHRRLASGEIDNYETEKRYVNAQGQTIWARLSVSLVRTTDREPQYVIAQIQDISDHRLMEKKLRHLADHDSLTGLPNRRFFEEQLAIVVGRCQRYGENATLLLLDLDGFKEVNDAHGHRSGDDVLKAVANAIREQIRASDTPARVGGDEFAVLLQAAGSEGAAVAEAIRLAIADTIVEVRHGVVGLTASIGTAFLDEQTTDAEAALTEADAAMYRDKTSDHSRPRATVRRTSRRSGSGEPGLA